MGYTFFQLIISFIIEIVIRGLKYVTNTLGYFGSAVDVTAGRARPQLLNPPAQRPFQCLTTDSVQQQLIGAAACRTT